MFIGAEPPAGLGKQAVFFVRLTPPKKAALLCRLPAQGRLGTVQQ
jgi:hypothetical protein